MKRAAAAIALAIASTAPHAGRPLTTEDAGVVDDKACQLESWIDRSRGTTAAWAVPACNFGGGVEWQAGFARSHADSHSFFSESYVQAKTVLRKPELGNWGFGAVVGLWRFPARPAQRGWENPYVIAPFTLAADETTTMHASIGWRHERAFRRDTTLWGLAFEHEATSRVTMVGEAFGEHKARPFVRLGARVNAIKDRLDFDLTGVTRPGGSRTERYVSVGLTWQSVPFLP